MRSESNIGLQLELLERVPWSEWVPSLWGRHQRLSLVGCKHRIHAQSTVPLHVVHFRAWQMRDDYVDLDAALGMVLAHVDADTNLSPETRRKLRVLIARFVASAQIRGTQNLSELTVHDVAAH